MGIFKKLFSNKFELLVGDIILLWYFDTPRDINKGYSGYFNHRYGIDPRERTNLLIEHGYLIKSSCRDSLPFYKMPQLKELCLTLDLPTNGRKADLISRLQEIDDLESYIKISLYGLSDLGKESLKSHYDYVKYHNNPFDLDVSQFTTLLKKCGSYNNVITNHLESSESSLANDESWGLYRNNKLKKAEFYSLIEQPHKEYLYYLETFYCDLSGYGNGSRSNLKDLMIAPGIIKQLNTKAEYFSDYMITTCISECKIPKHYFTSEQFYKIVKLIHTNDDIDLKTIIKIRKE